LAPDRELFAIARKLGYANQLPVARLIEMEVAFRHMIALKTSSRRMEVLTLLIALLTLAVVVLTGVLVWRELTA
jgi:hypothetical protein